MMQFNPDTDFHIFDELLKKRPEISPDSLKNDLIHDFIPYAEKLLKLKLEFCNDNDKMETIRIYFLHEMLDNLDDRNFSQYFFDGTFDCVPAGSEAKQLLICIGYNETKDIFLPCFFALLESKREKTYKELHKGIATLRNFRPTKITLDFEMAHMMVYFIISY